MGPWRFSGRNPPSTSDAGDSFDHFEGLRESACLPFGEDQVAIDVDIELSDASGLELGVVTGRLQDHCRETRSFGLVVSGLAVLDGDLHDGVLEGLQASTSKRCALRPQCR